MKGLVVVSGGKKFRYILRDFSEGEKPQVSYTNSYNQLLERLAEIGVPVVFSKSAIKQVIEDIGYDR